MTNKIKLHKLDIERILAVLECVHYNKDELVEIEIDSSSGIGSIGKVHVPVTFNSLKGTFTYELWGEETW